MKLIVGLGDGVPLTLLIGIPFQIAAKCVLDIDNLSCYSKTFDATWKLEMKVPHRKTLRSLDHAKSMGKRVTLVSISPLPHKWAKVPGE